MDEQEPSTRYQDKSRLPFRRIPDPTLAAKEVPVRPKVTQEPLEPLFEDDPRPSTIIKPQNDDMNVFRDLVMPTGGLIVCIGIVWFGVFNAGSFYTTGTRFSGELATIFYVWQVGNLLEIVGVVAGWECLKMTIKGLVSLRKSSR